MESHWDIVGIAAVQGHTISHDIRLYYPDECHDGPDGHHLEWLTPERLSTLIPPEVIQNELSAVGHYTEMFNVWSILHKEAIVSGGTTESLRGPHGDRQYSS